MCVLILTVQVSDKMKRLNDFVAELKTMDVAINTRDANEQHYEVTADFFQVRIYFRNYFSKYSLPHHCMHYTMVIILDQ